jgi:hypothetical protein
MRRTLATTAITLLFSALILLLTSHLHDSAHRFDVVMTAAGSGGSQQDAGSTTTTAFLVDHKTGRVWELYAYTQMPVAVYPSAPRPPDNFRILLAVRSFSSDMKYLCVGLLTQN